ncbi:MAG: VOC family protein [Rhodospirillales bacterium]
MSEKLNISFSHVGIFVKDLPRMARFYKEVFNFIETDEGEARGGNVVFLSRHPNEHHQIVLETAGDRPTSRIQQLSFRLPSLGDLRKMKERLENEEDATGLYQVNHCNAWSCYCYDPEENRIEVFVDTPYYVKQPCLHDLDLTMSNDEIMRDTEKLFGDEPTFKLRSEWSSELEKKIYG